MTDVTAKGMNDVARTRPSERRPLRRIVGPTAPRATSSPSATAPATTPGARTLTHFLSLPEPLVQPSSASHVVVLQQWEGVVERLEDDVVVGTVRDLTDPNRPDEIITFDRAEFSDADRGVLEVGVVFYWTIGLRIHAAGMKERVSRFELRRQPPLSRTQLLRAEQEASDHPLPRRP